MSHRVEHLADGVTLYLGDCRDVLPTLGKVDAVLTDPVWPNAPKAHAWEKFGWSDLAGRDQPQQTLADMFAALMELPKRAVIVVRNDSDPRFFAAVPSALPFFRAQILSYVLPSYIGRKLGGEELAYGFGEAIKPFNNGASLMPGRSAPAQPVKANGHPCSRSQEHFDWLMHWWSHSGETILDPFMGSGTTGVAAVKLGRRFIGIEIEPKYFDIACRRIGEAIKQTDLFINIPPPAKHEVLPL